MRRQHPQIFSTFMFNYFSLHIVFQTNINSESPLRNFEAKILEGKTVAILALYFCYISLTSCVTLGKLFNRSVPQFHACKMRLIILVMVNI